MQPSLPQQSFPWRGITIISSLEVLMIASLMIVDDRPRLALLLPLSLLLWTVIERIARSRRGWRPRVHPAVMAAGLGVGFLWFWIPVSVRSLASNGVEIKTLGDAILQHPLRLSSFVYYTSELFISALAAILAWRLTLNRPPPSSARPAD